MFHLTIEVPTSEGVTLRGVHYAPERTPAPVVMAVTPYGADRFHPHGKRFAARGFHFVGLDSRGRGDSDGRFIPFVHDAADGHDAVEWLADQPWSGGDVVLFGGSYCGFVQWAIASTRPAGLRAIAPTASVYPGVDFPMEGNIFLTYAVRWLSYVDGRRANQVPFLDDKFWFEATRAAVAAGRPLRDLDLASIGKRLPAFQEWLDHPEPDDYWDGFAPSPAERAEITIPVLTVTGQYDDDQLGALRYHDEHIAAVKPDVARRHHVVIGPWDHMGTRSGARSFGGLTFAEACEIDITALQADWYDWVLGRGGKPGLLTDRVVYFHSGQDAWRCAPDLPAGPEFLRLYPVDGGLAVAAPSVPQTVEFRADPRTVTEDSRNDPDEDTYFGDGAPLRHTGNLVLTTEPFVEALDLSGRFHARLVLASELADFDLLLGAYRVHDDGKTTLLGEALFRARYHRSLRAATPWPAGVPTPVEISEFSFISQRTTPGDRLALVIRLPHRTFQPNFHTGGEVADETLADAVPGMIRIVQDPELPSYLAFPLG